MSKAGFELTQFAVFSQKSIVLYYQLSQTLHSLMAALAYQLSQTLHSLMAALAYTSAFCALVCMS